MQKSCRIKKTLVLFSAKILSFNSHTDIVKELLLNSCEKSPVSFATWKTYDDSVFLSKKFQEILRVRSSVISSLEFISFMRKAFGNFLNEAVANVLDPLLNKSEHSALISSDLAGACLLKLNLDKTKNIYTLFAEKIQKNDSSLKALYNFEVILNNLPIHFWLKNKDSKITYCNKKYADALETSKEAVIIQDLTLIPKSRASFKTHNISTIARTKEFEEHVIIKGERKLFKIIEIPYVGDTPSIGIAIDITQQEQLKKELKDYKIQTEETLNNISGPIAIFDKETKLIFANESLIKLFHLKNISQYLGLPFQEIFEGLINENEIISIVNPIEYKNRAVQLFQTVIDEQYYSSIQTKAGLTFHLTVTPNNMGGLIFVLEDITDKIELERAVNSVLAVQKETIEHLVEGVIVFGINNRIKMFNSAVEEIFGISDKKIQDDMHIKEFFESFTNLFDSKDLAEKWLEKLINVSAQRIEFSDTIQSSTGKFIKYSYVPLPDGLNLLRFFDATDGAHLERALKEKTDIISQIDKLKTNLISTISYELRAPLNTISGFSEILYNKYFGNLNEKQLEYCHGIANAVTKLSDVVEAIINLASLQAGQTKLKYKDINVHKFIEQILVVFKTRATAQGISIEAICEDKKITAFFDEQLMKQVLFQILAKSLKMIAQNGNIFIKVQSFEENSDYLVILIKDSGIGMSDDELEKTKKMFLDDHDLIDKSVDFGLVFANSIVRLHHGKINIDCDNTGTSIKIIIPTKQFLM